MASKYAGAVLKAGKVAGSKRYLATPQKAELVKRLMTQAAEKATHKSGITAGEIYRDDLIEVLVGTLMEADKCDDDDDKKKGKKDNPFDKFKKKKKGKKDDDEEDDD